MARTAKKVSPVKPSPSKLIQSNFSQLASVTQATQKLIDSFVEEKSKVEKRAAELEKSLRACLKIISEAPPTAKAKFNAVIAAASLVGEKIPGTPGVNPSAEKPVKAAPAAKKTAAKKPAAKKPALKKAAPAAAPKAVAPKPATTAVKKTRGPKKKVAATPAAKTPEPAAVAKPKAAKPAAAKAPRKVALKSPKVAPSKIPLKSTNTESVAPVAAPSTEQPEVK